MLREFHSIICGPNKLDQMKCVSKYGMDSTNAMEVTNRDNTWIPLLQTIEDFEIYPNLSTRYVEINFGKIKNPMQFKITDAAGNAVFSKIISTPNMTYFLTPLNLANGMYEFAFDDLSFCVNSNIGLDELTDSKTVETFPNPANHTLSIAMDLEDISTYRIFSYDGKICKTGSLLPFESEISLENLESGCYFIKLDSKNKSFQSRFVKQ